MLDKSLYLDNGLASNELREMYRATFNTPQGKIVFMSILTDLGYFHEVEPGNVAGQANKAAAEKLLKNLAPHHEDSSKIMYQVTGSIVNTLVNIPMPKENNG